MLLARPSLTTEAAPPSPLYPEATMAPCVKNLQRQNFRCYLWFALLACGSHRKHELEENPHASYDTITPLRFAGTLERQ